MSNKEEVIKPIRTSVMSKQYGNEDFLADLITDACCKYLSQNLGLFNCLFKYLLNVCLTPIEVLVFIECCRQSCYF